MKKTPHFIYTSQQPLAWAHHPSEWHPHHPFNYTHAHANTQSERVTLSWIYLVTVYLLGAGGMGEVELFFAAKLLLSVFNTVCVCAKARVCVCVCTMWTRDAMHSWAVSKVTIVLLTTILRLLMSQLMLMSMLWPKLLFLLSSSLEIESFFCKICISLYTYIFGDYVLFFFELPWLNSTTFPETLDGVGCHFSKNI